MDTGRNLKGDTAYHSVQEQHAYGYAPMGPILNDSESDSQPKSKVFLYSDLLYAFPLAFLPLAAATVALIVLVYIFKLEPSGVSDIKSSDAFLVDISVTLILTISSWCATVVILIPGLLMTIFSYNVALRWTRHGYQNQTEQLPSPYQFSALIHLLSYGGLASLWRFVQMRWETRKLAQGIPGYLAAATIVLISSLVLGYSITAADTWLHVASRAVEFSTISPSESIQHSYGRTLSEACLDWQQNKMNRMPNMMGFPPMGYPCSAEPATSNTRLVNGTNAMLTVFNASAEHSVLNHDRTYFLAPRSRAWDIDYQARTIGAKTTCKTRTQDCKLEIHSSANITFDCADAGFPIFSGRIGDIFTDPSSSLAVSNNTENTQRAFSYTTLNPVRTAKSLFAIGINREGIAPNWDDPVKNNQSDVISLPRSQGVAFLLCETSILDLKYEVRNGTISRLDSTLAAEDYVSVLSGTLFAYGYYASAIQNAVFQAMLQNSIPEMETSYADSFSSLIVALGSGVMAPMPNDAEWIRRSKIVAKIPKAPLYTLVGLCFLYCALIFVVGVVAVISCLMGEVAAARACFTVEAVAKGAFEGKGVLDDFSEVGSPISPLRVGWVNEIGGERLGIVKNS